MEELQQNLQQQTGYAMVMGEITTNCYIDIQRLFVELFAILDMIRASMVLMEIRVQF